MLLPHGTVKKTHYEIFESYQYIGNDHGRHKFSLVNRWLRQVPNCSSFHIHAFKSTPKTSWIHRLPIYQPLVLIYRWPNISTLFRKKITTAHSHPQTPSTHCLCQIFAHIHIQQEVLHKQAISPANIIQAKRFLISSEKKEVATNPSLQPTNIMYGFTYPRF